MNDSGLGFTHWPLTGLDVEGPVRSDSVNASARAKRLDPWLQFTSVTPRIERKPSRWAATSARASTSSVTSTIPGPVDWPTVGRTVISTPSFTIGPRGAAKAAGAAANIRPAKRQTRKVGGSLEL